MAKQTFTTGQVLTAAQVNSLQANDFNQTVSVKTANYTLAAADKGTRIEFNTSGSVTCTVNSGLFDAGDTLVIQNRGAGTATITAGTATVNTSASLALAQYSAGTLYFVSDSAALFFGDAAGISASIVDAKGDLIVGTADNTVARLAVGTNGHTLVADSSVSPTGLKWAAPAAPTISSAWTLLSTGSVTNFTSTQLTASGYDRYLFHFVFYDAGNPVIKFRFNNLSATNYKYLATLGATGETFQTAADGINIDNFSTFNTLPAGFLEINNANTGTKPQFFGNWRRSNNGSADNFWYSGTYDANITLSTFDIVSTISVDNLAYQFWGL